MIIPIGERYRLRSDPLNWMLEEKVLRKRTRDSTPEDKDVWKKGDEYEAWVFTSCAFHRTIDSAIKALIELRVRKSQVEKLQEAAAEIVRVSREVREALQPFLSGLQSPSEGVSD